MPLPGASYHPRLLHLPLLWILANVCVVSADWQYKSRPDLSPPKLNITVAAGSVAPGHIFVAPYPAYEFDCRNSFGPLQPAPYIFTSCGDLIWSGFGYLSGLVVNFQAARYDGQDVLLGFESKSSRDRRGHGKILNQHYETIREVRSADHHVLDAHELVILDEGTVLVTIEAPVPFDLSHYEMKPDSQWILDATFQEIDLKTGKLLFQWSALEHVDPEESVYPISSFKFNTGHNSSDAVDYINLNSVDKDEDHNYLISSRHTSTVYKINGTTGEIIWRLGGKYSNFTLGDCVEFRFQHDARFRSKDGPVETVSIFDNSGPHYSDLGSRGDVVHSSKRSSGKLIELNTKTWEAKLLQDFKGPKDIFASSQGNNQILPNGNAFVNWGSAGALSEFTSDGKVVFHAFLDSGKLFETGRVFNYRAFKFNWTGIPLESPAIVALKHGESTMVYVSWNGDTETQVWRFYGIDEDANRKFLGEESRTGFETGFYVASGNNWNGFLAEAVDRDDRVLVVSGIAESRKYIYQYVPGRDDFIMEEKSQKVMGQSSENLQMIP